MTNHDTHTIRWVAYVQGLPVPRQTHMRPANGWRAFDASCSCGWASKTGGALATRVAEAVADHKADVAYEADPAFDIVQIIDNGSAASDRYSQRPVAVAVHAPTAHEALQAFGTVNRLADVVLCGKATMTTARGQYRAVPA